METRVELSDPSHFNPLISNQKSYLKDNPDDPRAWLKMGCFYEERLSMADRVVKRSFFLRYIFAHFFLLIFLFVAFFLKSGVYDYILTNKPSLLVLLVFVITLGLAALYSLRYPPSGSRFFKKAIALDPNCGEAYMHLGFIALRNHQKRKGCYFLEHALQLKVDDNRIKKELKYLYEKEFIRFFNTRKDEDLKKQALNDTLHHQVKKLSAKIHLLETNIAILKAKANQTRSQATRNVRIKSREMDSQMAIFSKKYQEKIAEIENEKIALEEEKDKDPIVYVKLSDELFNSTLTTENLSFHQTSETIKDTFELELWQSLSRQTKYYLVTAEQIYSILSKSDDVKDYSLIGLEWCKALELEINRKFVAPFPEYLGQGGEDFLRLNKTGERKNKPIYLSYLAQVIDKSNYPDTNALTLGQFHFALKQCVKHDYPFESFRQFMNEILSPSGEKGLRLFSEKLGVVVKKYRNSIAHQSSMNREQCQQLRELVFSGENSLLRLCSMAKSYPQNKG